MIIWNGKEAKINTRVYFRKKFNVEKIEDIIINVSADSKYYLWINGELLITEGGLNRGPTMSSSYFDEVDLTPYVHKGENTLAVLVWYWGNGGRNNKPSDTPGLLIDGYIKTDESFKCIEATAYKEGGAPYPAYLYGGYNISYDANEDIKGWQMPSFDDSMWQNATEIVSTSWGQLYKRPIPNLKNYGCSDYVKTTTEEQGENKIITAYLPYAAWVSPIFTIEAKKGDFIDIRTDRYVVNGGPGDDNSYMGQRTEYIARDGLQSFEAYNSYFGEQVIYTLPKSVTVKELKFRETGYNCELSGDFSCDDDYLNKLYEKCRRTLYVCMRDNFMDCPDRERGQWIGDVSTQSPQIFYSLSRSSDALLKKAICDFINWRENGVLRGNVPGIHCSELPSQSLNAISDIGMIKEYYMHTGDAKVLDFSIDAMVDYLLLWSMQSDGLVKPRGGNWPWFDHGQNIDSEVLENAWYALAIRFALSIKPNEELKMRLDSINRSFNKAFWKGEFYRGNVDFVDDRANAMAYLAGFADAEKMSKVIKVLKTVENSTPYMESYVLEAMFASGYKKEAMTRMKKRYKALTENENSTIWEDFYELGTKNHAWSGSPLTHLCKWVLGVRPTKPGYEEFVVEPYIAELKNVYGKIPSVKGDIEVKISDEGIFIKKPQNVAGKLLYNNKEYIFEKSASQFVLNF